jgi:hypothetical protein
MKKIAALVAAMLVFAAVSAFATDLTADTTKVGLTCTGDGKAIGKLSASVTMAAKYDTTAYAITTMNIKGTKTFGTSFDSTAIYSKEATIATPTNSNSTAFGTGWTAM